MRIDRRGTSESFLGASREALRSGFWSAVHSFKGSSNFSGVSRPASFPFISCDTFRSIADVVISNEFPAAQLDSVPLGPNHEVIMVELSFLKNYGGKAPLLEWLSKANLQSASVVLHNGDWVPDDNFLGALSSTGARVFCVNTLDGIPGVTPIPVGLENLTRKKNGVLDDFLFQHDIARRPFCERTPRKNLVFSSFKIETNPGVRKPLAKALRMSRHGFSSRRLAVRDFRREILDSSFVVSPPGNGPDCYRTWEAIYLGAVPIVLRGSLAQSLSSDLPIWVVDSWDEFLGASDYELEEKFALLSTKPSDKAFFPHWLAEISGTGRDGLANRADSE